MKEANRLKNDNKEITEYIGFIQTTAMGEEIEEGKGIRVVGREVCNLKQGSQGGDSSKWNRQAHLLGMQLLRCKTLFRHCAALRLAPGKNRPRQGESRAD